MTDWELRFESWASAGGWLTFDEWLECRHVEDAPGYSRQLSNTEVTGVWRYVRLPFGEDVAL